MPVIRTLLISVVSALMAVFSLASAANAGTLCRPPLPPLVPNDFDASKADILAASKNIKENFQPAIRNFQHCISTEKTAVGDIATAAQIEEWDMLFDAAYKLETQVAHNMNLAIRAYKARVAAKTDKTSPPK